MHFNNENYDFSVEETEDGFAFHIKGDKEKLAAKIEAFKAYMNFREKAEKAGFDGFSHHHSAHHGHHGHYGCLSGLVKMHKHFVSIHNSNSSNCKTEKSE